MYFLDHLHHLAGIDSADQVRISPATSLSCMKTEDADYILATVQVALSTHISPYSPRRIRVAVVGGMSMDVPCLADLSRSWGDLHTYGYALHFEHVLTAELHHSTRTLGQGCILHVAVAI